jgi:hypothetical protein
MEWKDPHKPVSFEVALLAKQKGYDWPCNWYYEGDEENPALDGPDWDDDYENLNEYDGLVSAPSYFSLELWIWTQMDGRGKYVNVEDFRGSYDEILIHALNACKYD